MAQYAYCWRSGKIEFGPKVPAGALPIGRGGKVFREKVEVHARLSRDDNETLLVPGIPEANNSNEAIAALSAFTHRIADALRGGKAVLH